MHNKIVSPRRQRVLTYLLAFSTFLVPHASLAQNWSYQGTQICFQSASNISCFSQGTIISTTSELMSQPANNSFNQAYQQGEAIGSVIGSLTNAWMAHRRQVKQKRKH